MKYFVLWSGGLDSTALIYRLLEQNHEVVAGYVKIGNNREKTKRELRSIKSIRKYLESYKFTYCENFLDMTGIFCNDAYLKMVPIFLFASLSTARKEYDRIAIGYCQNDCAISWLNDIERAFYAHSGLFSSKLPKLEFPLSKIAKEENWHYLNPKIRKLVTWCENFEKQDNCGQCSPCLRMSPILEKLQNVTE